MGADGATKTTNAKFLHYCLKRCWAAEGASEEHASAVADALMIGIRQRKLNQGLGVYKAIDITNQIIWDGSNTVAIQVDGIEVTRYRTPDVPRFQQGLRRLPLALLAAGWMLGVIALAGPVWERLPQPVYQAQQHRVVLLDLSPWSAAAVAGDVLPTRYRRRLARIQPGVRPDRPALTSGTRARRPRSPAEAAHARR